MKDIDMKYQYFSFQIVINSKSSFTYREYITSHLSFTWADH